MKSFIYLRKTKALKHLKFKDLDEYRNTDLQGYRNERELEDVVIPEGATKVYDSFFFSCPQLKNVTFPASMVEIGKFAFADCVSLSQIEGFSDTNLIKISTSAFENTALENMVLPDTVVELGSSAFAGCKRLESFVISKDSSLVYIGDHCFRDCESLRELYLPDHIKKIGVSAFKGCNKLSRISIPESCTEEPGILELKDSDIIIEVRKVEENSQEGPEGEIIEGKTEVGNVDARTEGEAVAETTAGENNRETAEGETVTEAAKAEAVTEVTENLSENKVHERIPTARMGLGAGIVLLFRKLFRGNNKKDELNVNDEDLSGKTVDPAGEELRSDTENEDLSIKPVAVETQMLRAGEKKTQMAHPTDSKIQMTSTNEGETQMAQATDEENISRIQKLEEKLASLNEKFENYRADNDSRQTKVIEVVPNDIEEELARLRAENEALRAKQDMVSSALIDARAYGDELRRESERQEEEFRAHIRAKSLMARQRVEDYQVKLDTLRDNITLILSDLLKEVERAKEPLIQFKQGLNQLEDMGGNEDTKNEENMDTASVADLGENQNY